MWLAGKCGVGVTATIPGDYLAHVLQQIPRAALFRRRNVIEECC
jgi:hypothetical protein